MPVFHIPFRIPLGLLLLFGYASAVHAQVRPVPPAALGLGEVSWAGLPTYARAVPVVDDETPPAIRLRQSILLGSVTLSALGYGIFALRFNRARARSEIAEQVYLDDLRSNGQSYLEAGLELDQTPAFRAWEADWKSAVVAREWNSRMGALTLISALFTILDSATTGTPVARKPPKRLLMPYVHTSALHTGPQLHLGARISF